VSRRLLFVVLTSLTGCALVRAPILDDPEPDGGVRPDASGLDAPPIDSPIPAEDTPMLPLDRGVCAASDTTCDGVDDDCDGTVDNMGCTIGATCVPFTIDGVAYQSCPAITGIDAWSGACRRMGTGYELASFADAGAQDRVRSRLETLGVGGPHWIAANDFDESGAYVWWDGSVEPTLDFDGGPKDDPSHRCVAFRSDGFYEEGNCDDDQRVLCAADLRARRCVASEEIRCNAVDDDCDGSVDEGSDCDRGCTTESTFWTHVYYFCSEARRGDDEAPGHCNGSVGASQLATVNNSTELSVLADRIGGDSWVALSQSAGQSSPTAGWHWPDTGVTFGTDVTVSAYPWGGGEPNDGGDNNENNQENCGLLRGDDRFDDRDCNNRLSFICENTWSYPL